MICQFDDLDQISVGRQTGKDHAVLFKVFAIFVVELKAMAVAFFNFRRSIRGGGFAALLQLSWIEPEPHRPAHICDGALVKHQVNDGVFC